MKEQINEGLVWIPSSEMYRIRIRHGFYCSTNKSQISMREGDDMKESTAREGEGS